MPPPPTQPKLRVLCLHGYRQNASNFSGRIGHMRKGLKGLAEFHFVQAPHPAPSLDAPASAPSGDDTDGDALDAARDDPRSWWRWDGDGAGPAGRPSLVETMSGWKETSLPLLRSTLIDAGPFDGVLGFSQGGCAAAMLLADLPVDARPRFAILAGAFLPKCQQEAAAVHAARLSVPTLFVSGEKDALIPPARSEALAAVWEPGTVEWLRHGGGHSVPTCSGEVKDGFRRFLGRFR